MDTLSSVLVRLVDGKERWDAPGQPQGVLYQNWGETELQRSVTPLSDTGIGSEDQTQSKPCFSSCNDLGGGFKAPTSLPR
ncbi:hypothetical protein TNCV_193461 [Trichonephila clavipes]|nr:hypothetical protein TNCV_193461 [Trichonephila clavipes]